MPKVYLCPHENVNWSGISYHPDGIGVGLYVKDLKVASATKLFFVIK